MTVAPERRFWLAFLVFVAATLPAVTARIYASDEIEYFAYLRSLYFDRDLSFENEYRHFYERGIAASPGFRETFLELRTETGRRHNFATIGCALLWLPFYAAADAGVQIARRLGAEIARDGYSQPYISAVCYASALYGLLAVVLSAHAASALSPRTARTAAAAVLLGTPLLFYTYISPPFSHASSAFAVAAFVVAWLKVRRRWSPGGMALLGALAALMTMVREQDAFFVIGPALDLVWRLLSPFPARRPAPRQVVLGAAAGAAAFALAFVPQAAAYLALNGRLGPARLVSRKMTWSSPHAAGVLLSPEHGFLWWTPLGALALAGLAWLLLTGGRDRHASGAAAGALGAGDTPADAVRVAICCLAMFAGQVYIAGSVESWTVAGAFGQRRFVSLTCLLAIGLAALLGLAPRGAARRLATAALVLAVWWNIGLMAQFGTGLMDRQRLELRQNAYNTFVVVPLQLPVLAYRYVFDRGSFYRPPPWRKTE